MASRCFALVVLILALISLSVTALAAPGDDFTFTPSTPNVGDTVVFTCEPSPCPASANVEWDFDGGDDFERSGHSVTTTFQTGGPVNTHTVRMRITRANDGETIVTKTVNVNAPPAVTFDFVPSSPLTDQPVQFSAQAIDPEGDAVSPLAWTFGDGATATGAAPTHAYAGTGTFTVTVTATDSKGATGSATHQIVVRPDGGPSSSFDFSPTVPDVGQTVNFTASAQASQGSITARDWDLDGDGQFDDFSGAVATWAFNSPGEHVVRLRVQQTNGKSAISERRVRVNGLPVADFTWNPPRPVAGESLELVSTTTDFEGPPTAFSWDLDGDGQFGDGSASRIRQPFAAPGTYDIGLRVTDSDGAVSTVRKRVTVAAPPVKPRPRPRLMSPFPVIRIAGTVLPRAALIRVLSVRAPRGSQVRVRCVGKGCPVDSVARTSATHVVRFRRFERTLRAGIRLKLFVRQANRIGKYTSFRIRAGAPPKRVDLCLFPTRRSPGRCP